MALLCACGTTPATPDRSAAPPPSAPEEAAPLIDTAEAIDARGCFAWSEKLNAALCVLGKHGPRDGGEYVLTAVGFSAMPAVIGRWGAGAEMPALRLTSRTEERTLRELLRRGDFEAIEPTAGLAMEPGSILTLAGASLTWARNADGVDTVSIRCEEGSAMVWDGDAFGTIERARAWLAPGDARVLLEVSGAPAGGALLKAAVFDLTACALVEH